MNLNAAADDPLPDVALCFATRISHVRGADNSSMGHRHLRTLDPQLHGDSDGEVQNSVCGSLLSLTHMSWCDGSGDGSRLQSEWRRWWGKDPLITRIYGN